MGIIIGKFRKKKSTYDVLEKLEQEIVSIEEFGRSTEQTRKKIIGRFILLAVLVYVILAFVLYIYYHRISTNQRLICIIPLIGFPLIIWVIKRVLTWYYSRKIRKNEKKLVSLKDEKKKMLDNVMETETYKVAKKILDKFGDTAKKPLPLTTSESTPVARASGALVPSVARPSSHTGLRQRNVGMNSTLRGRLSLGAPQSPYPTSQFAQFVSPMAPNRSLAGFTSMMPSNRGPTPGTPLPLPRSILPRDRSVLDKMVDYLVGDGPSNRYALICKQCNSHNGMSLKEEFEYLSFRCCYCSAFNPARKQRPTGPKFETSPSLKALPANSSDSEKNSDSDTDSAKMIITETRGDSPDVAKVSDIENEKLSIEEEAKEAIKTPLDIMQVTDEDISPMDVSETEEVDDLGQNPEEVKYEPESENETLKEQKD
ncbi:hypothetical protein NQ315_007238 [Exocentrus adspersus]|uniref:Endoplasmic reticulum junction formation protein lunapark n=1 Tax=Exocentrus adspersus TaxID=1586481 RepID=A0AAV8WDV3_9CUCU|nr:hypothetical protein NQ315_007238 [Exocentrus adspersus]